MLVLINSPEVQHLECWTCLSASLVVRLFDVWLAVDSQKVFHYIWSE